jgi:spermidine/putrescine transport system ATP-binding protein
LLRILGGFVPPTAGRVLLGGRDVTSLPPERRPVNMVFQRPTLFPHLDVFDNVAFGLRVARLAKNAITDRVEEALAMVGLGDLMRRRAYELSGGQMQRVAFARALVNRPAVLLLDEPLSALDLTIRLEMEVELRRLHAETGATFVYVTHDQREAMSLSDRVAVLSHGQIEQLGAPLDVYRSPASAYVARFVGDANVLPVEVRGIGPGASADITLAGARTSASATPGIAPGPAQLVVRAEHVDLVDEQALLKGRVLDRAFRGTCSSYLIEVAQLPEPIRAEVRGTQLANGEPEVGANVGITWNCDHARLIADGAAG